VQQHPAAHLYFRLFEGFFGFSFSLLHTQKGCLFVTQLLLLYYYSLLSVSANKPTTTEPTTAKNRP